eukprot:597460-Pyramimonas_sp.AAC.1
MPALIGHGHLGEAPVAQETEVDQLHTTGGQGGPGIGITSACGLGPTSRAFVVQSPDLVEAQSARRDLPNPLLLWHVVDVEEQFTAGFQRATE